MREKEKEVNKLLLKKRQSFSEALKYLPEQVTSALRMYIDIKFIFEGEENFIQFNILGKFLLNEKFDNSF